MLFNTDGKNAMLDRLGYTGADIEQKERAMWVDQGFTYPHNWDAMFAYLGSLGYTGTLQDRMNQWIAAGGYSSLEEFYASHTFVVTDPYWANVVTLLRFEGADASTTFTDDTGRHTFGANGSNAQIDTADKKWGASSLLLDGTTDEVRCVTSTDYDFGSAPWTIEMWIKPDATSTGLDVVGTNRNSFGPDPGFIIFISWTTSKVSLQTYGPTAGTAIGTASSTGTIAKDVWTYLAFGRNGNDFNCSINGSVETLYSSASAIANSTFPFIIGIDPSTAGREFKGWIDSYRVTKGVYRDISVVPTKEFPTS